MKKYYLVTLTICGEVEKQTTHLVKATCKDNATKLALLVEAHLSIGDGAEFEGKGLSDFHGEYYYTPSKVQEVDNSDVSILKTYLNVSS